jgi:hypothetical protein
MDIETSVCLPAFMRTTLHIIGSVILLAAFVMSSNNCETYMDYLTTARDDVTDSSQNPLRHSRHSGVPVSNGQACMCLACCAACRPCRYPALLVIMTLVVAHSN